MIGIICAMAVELEGLKAEMKNIEVTKLARMDFIRGAVKDSEVVAVECGVGKVNAAMCAQIMIDKFSPAVIINSGVAGAVSEEVGVYDAVIATEVLQHDMNTTALGDPRGEISFNDESRTCFPCDKDSAQRLEKACGKNAFRGRVASGDIFVSQKEDRLKINRSFGALACEMEGGAIGHVCYRNNVPFCVFRVISDDLKSSKGEDFRTFCKKASDISVGAVLNFIKSF